MMDICIETVGSLVTINISTGVICACAIAFLSTITLLVIGSEVKK